MTSPFVEQLFTVFCLILLNGFFAGAEVAVLSSRQQEADFSHIPLRYKAFFWAKKSPEKFFATVQIVLTIVSSLASVYGGAAFISLLEFKLQAFLSPRDAHLASLACVVGGLSYLSLVLGELLPKMLGLQYCERIAPWAALGVYLLGKALCPAVYFVSWTSRLFIKPFTLMARLRARKNRGFRVEGGSSSLDSSNLENCGPHSVEAKVYQKGERRFVCIRNLNSKCGKRPEPTANRSRRRNLHLVELSRSGDSLAL